MAGGPSPSPSSSSRRLSELLDQQQEPFSLDIYLLEKGCSPAFLDAAIGSGGGTCWPWPRTRSTVRRPLRLAARKNGSCVSLVLRLLLCNILSCKMAKATAKKKQLNLPAIDRGLVDGENQRAPGYFGNSTFPRCDAEAGVVVKAEEVEDGKDGDSNKRLSPDSVLEQTSALEHPPPVQEQKALLIFREHLQEAYSPTLRRRQRRQPQQLQKKLHHQNLNGVGEEQPCTWQQEDVFVEALAEVTSFITNEMARTRTAWPRDALQLERRDVGTDIAVAVLDALVEEMATELIDDEDGRP